MRRLRGGYAGVARRTTRRAVAYGAYPAAAYGTAAAYGAAATYGAAYGAAVVYAAPAPTCVQRVDAWGRIYVVCP